MNWKPLIFSLLLALPVLADDFHAANGLYDAGKFAEAAAAYAKIEPKTAHVYFNLGNALFRQEKFGLAVLNYERARRLAPRDPDILANLRFAEQRLGVHEVNTSPNAYRRFIQSFVSGWTPNEWGRFELAALWMTVLGIAGAIWARRFRTGWLLISAMAGVAWVMTAGALLQAVSARPGAVVVASSEARFAPTADATVHFKLPEGARVSISEDRGSWALVGRADGQQGWVKTESLERIASD